VNFAANHHSVGRLQSVCSVDPASRFSSSVRYLAVASFAASALLFDGQSASAQVSKSGYVLSLDFAIEAAREAVNVCAGKGYDVTATLVDVAGTPQVVLRGDHSTIHTKDTSFRKAYTVVTMGPIFHFERLSQFLAILDKYPPLAAQSLAATPNVSALPGAVAIEAHGKIVAGLGVGGSPGGDRDEECAKAGLLKIQDKLPK
jgi:uncharacterized protein GlcG (DUF336 family)